MLSPVGVKNLEKMDEGKYVLQYKKMGGCLKYTKYFTHPLKALKCIRTLEKSRKYTFQVYREVY